VKWLFAFGLIGFLAACVPQGPVEQIRDPAVTMSATSRFEAAQFAGLWIVRADYPGDWDLGVFEFTAPTGDKSGAWRESGLTTPGSPLAEAQVGLDIVGVFTLTYAGRPEKRRQMVVLWVDEGFRTAVLAMRDGSYAMIVDRKAAGGADRIIAAQSVLEHNGFDLAKLREVKL
jgi:apolipoprotein D and lipocalin family protein